MGLYAYAKGLSAKDSYNKGYITFGVYRKKLAKAYNEKIGYLYEKIYDGIDLTEEEGIEWDKICNDDLDIFLWHSDCDGKFTPQECKKIYNAMKNIKVNMQEHKYIIMETNCMHVHWLNIFRYCYKRRVNLYFS